MTACFRASLARRDRPTNIVGPCVSSGLGEKNGSVRRIVPHRPPFAR